MRIKLIREYKGMPVGATMQVTEYLANRLYNNGFCEDFRPAVEQLKRDLEDSEGCVGCSG